MLIITNSDSEYNNKMEECELLYTAKDTNGKDKIDQIDNKYVTQLLMSSNPYVLQKTQVWSAYKHGKECECFHLFFIIQPFIIISHLINTIWKKTYNTYLAQRSFWPM